jgi:SAM-dependent methyltransferase
MRFAIHRTDLSRRRQRCAEAVRLLERLPREAVACCNLCESRRRAVISNGDRYGNRLRAAMCLDCGLIYMLDRLSRGGYAEFYEKGLYRELIGCFKGEAQGADQVQAAQVYYARTLARGLAGLLPGGQGKTLLDVGGSAGVVAREVGDAFGYRPTLFDPAPEEVEAARVLGVEAEVASIEEFESKRRFDLVLLCRTVEHVYDLRGALAKIRNLVAADGLFYCDFSDFLEVCRREGPPEATTKVDHAYWLVQETAPALFAAAGFEVVSMNNTMSPEQVGFLMRPSEPAPLLLPPPEIQRQLRLFREIDSDWRLDGQGAYDARDWVRTRAYRLKRRLVVNE